jgi:hypothetical protein
VEHAATLAGRGPARLKISIKSFVSDRKRFV